MLNEISPKSVKFEIIFNFQSKFKINNLSKILWVSISWYYRHRKLIETNNIKIQRENWDLELIKTLVLKYNQKYWYRMINMLLKSEYNLIMNHKKVLRIMLKYNLLSWVRKRNPYKNIAKATQEHRTCNNILARVFDWITPLSKLWTDISYLYYKWNRAYLSILKDMISWEIVSHKLSSNLWLWFVLDTIEKAKNRLKNWNIIHSDQWFHYTNPNYQELLKKNWIIQSMSRRWNCLDNAPTESFFWHLKDEIDLSKCNNFKELEIIIENYIFHYNNERPQWNKKKMTPVQYRNHLLNLI